MRIAQASIYHLGDRLNLRFVLEHLAGTVVGIAHDPNLPACVRFRQVNTVCQFIERAEFLRNRFGQYRSVSPTVHSKVDMILNRCADNIPIVFLLL